jgi:hypothetical protein
MKASRKTISLEVLAGDPLIIQPCPLLDGGFARSRRCLLRLALDQIHDTLLSLCVRFNVSLGGAERSVASEHLHVPERASHRADRARCVGDEGATT